MILMDFQKQALFLLVGASLLNGCANTSFQFEGYCEVKEVGFANFVVYNDTRCDFPIDLQKLRARDGKSSLTEALREMKGRK